MVAFVTPSAPVVSSSTTRFVTGSPSVKDNVRPALPAPRRHTPSMNILDGLDTVNQDSYTFSRYILGPFQPVVLSPNSSDEDREVAISAAYRHIFGNAYLMEEERKELEVHESQFKLGALTAKEFVRAIGKSSAYKTRFFEGASQYRFVELNFMHFLGRAPDSREEMSEHHNRYFAEGVDADIDSYIDSAEYDSVFGEDNIPFLRFRGAYTPCDSFNKQCALKGGWANSDKAMGSAAISGYNGSDGHQICDHISSYIDGVPTPYETVAANTPLKTTAPNWLAYPDPALPPTPAYVSEAEVRTLAARVSALEEQYDFEISRRSGKAGDDAMAPFRAMVADMPMLERGYSFSDPLLANPASKQIQGASPVTDAGQKTTDYRRYGTQMDSDTLSRLERDLEEAKAQLRVLEKALANSKPMTPEIVLPSAEIDVGIAAEVQVQDSRPRISTVARPPTPVAAKDSEPIKFGPFTLPSVNVPSISMPSISMPSISMPSLPFKK